MKKECEHLFGIASCKKCGASKPNMNQQKSKKRLNYSNPTQAAKMLRDLENLNQPD